ncbi:hypothetical protein [Mycoplana sp. MJR14]|uniref:hypothetical protein n=1 Tax=Mycoplana sp. MJR14 TaxID=3032583 RepID=UPI0023DACFA4|nr:hypothetical protein [Mycoplana sp. MJR14]MDF1631416.1 hypothetical protein [Mycoplana sp. MJR14]
MADSDNSRTLPTVIRGEFHSFVAASLPTSHSASRPLLPDRGDDPALAVWTQWCATWKRLCESVLRQQQLETTLISYVWRSPHEQAAASQAYEEALQAEACAFVAEADAAGALWGTPALSIAGVAAKLHAAVTKWQPSPTSRHEPWPQIRSAIDDLLRIDGAAGTGGRSWGPAPESRCGFEETDASPSKARVNRTEPAA